MDTDRPDIFCSVIIPTIGRASLARAVTSALNQGPEAGELEVIVVNDSDSPLTKGSWQDDPRVRILNSNRRERSTARNTGAAAARGSYLCFLDDDDWLLPGGLGHLRALAQTTSAGWLYGASQLVDRRARPLIVLRHGLSGNGFIQAMSGEWIPLQSSLIKSEAFHRVGGFNPLLSGPEDVDLLRRIALHYDLAETPGLVGCIGMGEEDSTTDRQRSLQDSRWARERIIDEPGVLGRMKQSARSSFWRGRIVRLYLTSAVWNLRRGRFFPAAARLFWTGLAFLTSLPSILSKSFWRAVLRHYDSPTFGRGLQAAGLNGSQISAGIDTRPDAAAANLTGPDPAGSQV